MKINVGIDLGSTAIKIIFLKDREIVWKRVVPTVPGQAKIADDLISQGLAETGYTRDQLATPVATGYGKGLVHGAGKVIDEVSANAIGVFSLSRDRARTIINIGGQDVKVIRLSERGRLIDFKMNDKCAAGTGRFFEVAGRILDTPVEDFGDLGQSSKTCVTLSSTCVVFAESEIVSLMAKGVERQDIIQGLHESIARRIAGLAGSRDIEDEVYLDGGSANNSGLVAAIEDELYRDVYVLPHPQFSVAYGAALSLD